MQGIEPIACLGIGQSLECLHREPEVRELIGKGIAAGHVLLLQVPCPDDQRTGMLLQGLDELGDILREMLPVAVDGDRIVVPHLLGFPEACNQGMPLAFVLGIVDQCQGNLLQLCQLLAGIIRTSVDDDDNLGGNRSYTPHDIGNSPAVVVGWYNNTDFPCFHLLTYIYTHYLIII